MKNLYLPAEGNNDLKRVRRRGSDLRVSVENRASATVSKNSVAVSGGGSDSERIGPVSAPTSLSVLVYRAETFTMKVAWEDPQGNRMFNEVLSGVSGKQAVDVKAKSETVVFQIIDKSGNAGAYSARLLLR